MTSQYQVPRLAIARPSLFRASEIELFEELLSNPAVTEHDASKFFAQFPKFLFLGHGKDLRREVSLFNSEGRIIGRVDFFRCSYGRRYWDIIELKDPNKPIITDVAGKHPRFSAEVGKAINQAQDYQQWIKEDAALRGHLLQQGILVYRPQILVVVGKDTSDVSPELMEELYDRIRSKQIVVASYSYLLEFAKEHYEANGVIILCGQIGSSREEISSDILQNQETRIYNASGPCCECGAVMDVSFYNEDEIYYCENCGKSEVLSGLY